MDATKIQPVIHAQSVSKNFRIHSSLWSHVVSAALRRPFRNARELPALRDVSLEAYAGECVGLMGPNGAGKSTLLRILIGALFPSSGTVRVRGHPVLLDLGRGMRAELSGRDNLRVAALALGMSRRDVDERLERMVEFSELGRAIDEPLQTYSSGMAMRLAFSLYASIEPAVLIVDEALAVGDAHFVLKCVGRIRELLDGGCTVILASHDSHMVTELCNRALLLVEGRVAHEGPPVEVSDAYHAVLGVPSTRGGTRGARVEEASEGRSPEGVREFLAQAIHRKGPIPLLHGGDAEIVAYRLLRNGEAASGLFEHGDECGVQWLVRAHRGFSRPLTSGVHLHTPLGTYVFGTSYVHLGTPLRMDQPGYYLLGISFRLELAPGKYIVSLGIAEPDAGRNSIGGRQIDRVRYAVELEIAPFDLAPAQPVPFFGLARLSARASAPVALDES